MLFIKINVWSVLFLIIVMFVIDFFHFALN